VFAAKKMESIKSRGEKTAVSIGHTYCIGDAGAVKNLAEELGSEIFSYANRENGLAKVIGFDRSPNTLEEVTGCDRIIVFGSAIFQKPVLLSKLRKAVEYGAVVTVISDIETDFNIPCEIIKTPNSTDFIKQITKALIDKNCTPRNAVGFDELKNSLDKVQVGEHAKALAESYKSAKKAMIIYSIEELSGIAATEIANMAVVSGHIGSPRSGVYMLRQMAGSQILADMNITASAEAAATAKGLMIFGEDICIDAENYEFIMVQDTQLTEIASKADVVFPLMIFPEVDGMYANSERKLSWTEQAVESEIEYRTSEIAQKIAEVFEKSISAPLPCELYPNASLSKPYPESVLCADGFGFDDKKARLRVEAEAPMLEPAMQTSHLAKSINSL
jgi:formate dehydrogenase major subunit